LTRTAFCFFRWGGSGGSGSSGSGGSSSSGSGSRYAGSAAGSPHLYWKQSIRNAQTHEHTLGTQQQQQQQQQQRQH
jgi:hypothetical protein